MINIGSYCLLGILTIIVLYALFKKVKVFDCFVEGAKSGIGTAKSLLPPLLGLIVVVNMLDASGGINILIKIFEPITAFFGIPPEILPLCIFSPISGSGSLSMFENILTKFGADSYIGRVASVISGATETTFYAITVYYGAIGIKKTRHTVFAALCADFTSFILASFIVKILFY
ncbi:MAG: spore maturation protein [Oscillospiraceae bacterium]